MIRVVDVETTGMSAAEGAEVIELGWWDVHEEGLVSTACGSGQGCTWGSVMFTPVRPCPPEVRAVHHIHPSECEGAPVFHSAALRQQLSDHGITHVAAHNAEYEQQFLILPDVWWVCTYKCALRVWPDAPHHGNQSLMYWLGLDEEISEQLRHPPHRALPDAYVTAHILSRLLEECSLDQLVAWSGEPRLLARCPIGEHKGRPWPEVPWSFLNWYVTRASRTEPDTVWNVQRELARRRTEHLRGD